MIKSCVIGDPVEHSLSPRLHGYWLRRYGIKGDYQKRAVAPADLSHVLQSLPSEGFAGCNLTIPHKTAALPHMHDLSPRASAIGAVNTVVVMNDGGLLGDNTDAYGYISGLTHQVPNWRTSVKHAAVIGAGGAARAIVYGLMDENVPTIDIFNRTQENAAHIASDLSAVKSDSKLSAYDFNHLADTIAHYDLIINTTPLGMSGHAPLPLELSNCKDSAVISDIVYNPRMTPLLTDAKARGLQIAEGIHMLIYQGVPGFEYWYSQHPTVDEDIIRHMQEGLK